MEQKKQGMEQQKQAAAAPAAAVVAASLSSEPSSERLPALSASTHETAVALLRSSSWFESASNELVQALASLMIPMSASDGHVFVEEGTELRSFMIVEDGTLARTRLSVPVETREDVKSSIRSLHHTQRTAAIDEQSVLIDLVQGRGRTTGFLHNVEPGNLAYATVSARGPVKVWLVSGDDFRTLIRSNGAFGLEVINVMAHDMRKESNAMRALQKRLYKLASEAENGRSDRPSQDGRPVLKVLCYDATSWVTTSFQPAIEAFNKNNDLQILMQYTTERLGPDSVTYSAGYDAICTFVNDTANADVLHSLSLLGVQLIVQRAAGFDRIDLKAARAHNITVARVPKYSPYAVAEMAMSLLLTVNRKLTRASNRVKMANFTLDEGLLGMDIHGKTIGVMGTGNIGAILCRIVCGFGAKLVCYDVYENDDVKKMGGVYVKDKDELLAQCDVLFLMMPLLPSTHHTISMEALSKLKKGVILINTSRGGLVDTKAVLEGLRSDIISGVGMDVYENEQDYFFQDWSARQVQDPDLAALLGNNNVVLTAHQAFFTKEAVDKIVSTTLENIRDYHAGLTGTNHPNNCIPPA